VADVRENILARLVAVAASIPGIKSAQRDNVDITEEHLPVAMVFDGDEETNDAGDQSMRPAHRPTVVQMTPEITIIDMADLIGPALNIYRAELIKRVTTDTELNEQIVKTGRHGNGAIRYLGCDVGIAWVRERHGALHARFLFKYVLKPDEL